MIAGPDIHLLSSLLYLSVSWLSVRPRRSGMTPPTVSCRQAVSRHQCHLLLDLLKEDFLANGGDERWLDGLQHVPKKLSDLNEVNKLMAHRPWLLNKSHIEVSGLGGRTGRPANLPLGRQWPLCDLGGVSSCVYRRRPPPLLSVPLALSVPLWNPRPTPPPSIAAALWRRRVTDASLCSPGCLGGGDPAFPPHSLSRTSAPTVLKRRAAGPSASARLLPQITCAPDCPPPSLPGCFS